MNLAGYIQSFDGKFLKIVAPFENGYLLEKKQITECEIIISDGRRISADQRKKIYAVMRDISLYTGFASDEIKSLMKYDFIAVTGCKYFSLSDVDMTIANEFLNHLIEFCISWDVPTMDSLCEISPDISRYIYCCLVHKKCCITGKKAELHHVDAIGQGRDRRDIIHTGMRVLPLSRKMHTEAHTIGVETFCNKYHVTGIKLDNDLCKIWKVKGDK